MADTDNGPATPPTEGLGTDNPTTPPRTTNKHQPPTPIIPKSATSQPFTSTHIERQENLTMMWHEISGKVLGPMPANIFLDNFIPAARFPAPAINQTSLKTMMGAKKETSMYAPFVSYFFNFLYFSVTDLRGSRLKLFKDVAQSYCSLIPAPHHFKISRIG